VAGTAEPAGSEGAPQWRVLYRIDESKHAVIVQDIQHRSSAYRRR
jgi:mRNA-degrading endonuclease RelE of RelBE toxin-antitoxin system